MLRGLRYLLKAAIFLGIQNSQVMPTITQKENVSLVFNAPLHKSNSVPHELLYGYPSL